MNRQHAEHLLDAYVQMRMSESHTEASDALREVILDAMTEYKSQTISSYPRITLPVDNTPKVTWTGHDPLSPSYVTCTGYDTIHGTCAAGVMEE